MVSAAALHRELWTSWASLLRSYAAAHGLGAAQHAVVEVSADAITLRVGPRWMHFTPTAMERDDAPPMPFHLNHDGTVTLGTEPAEGMDMAAERFTRELLHPVL